MTQKAPTDRIFISHSSADADFARLLSLDLRLNGFHVWFAEWEMRVGDSIQSRLSSAIHKSAYMGVVLSPDSVKSKWVKYEINAALARELEQSRVYLLPILFRECVLPVFLKDKLYADFTNDYELGLTELLVRLRPTDDLGSPLLTDLVDRHTLVEIIRRYSRITKSNTSVMMRDGGRIRGLQGPESEYYRLLSQTSDPALHPIAREREAFRLVMNRGSSLVNECACGTSDVCMPIYVDEMLVGVILGGQVVARQPDETVVNRLQRQAQRDGLQKNALVDAHSKLRTVTKREIERQAESLLQMSKEISAEAKRNLKR